MQIHFLMSILNVNLGQPILSLNFHHHLFLTIQESLANAKVMHDSIV